MAVVAQGVVELIPSAKGFSSKVQKEIGGDLSKAGDKQGRGLGGKISKGFGLAAKAGFAGAGSLAGAALVKGFGRLKSLDEAEGKLRGLGHSTKTVDGIMKNALGSVKGTAFGMDEAATTAAGAVAAGIKPGKDLESVLTLVGDAATIGGSSMSDMGAIFNKVASTGKVQGDVLAQLGDQGIPIVQFLSKELGVSAQEVTKLASEGEISFEDFRNAMESGLGGAAQSSGKTFSGAMANAGAALGRLGASLLSGIFPKMKSGLGGITQALDSMGPAAEAVGSKIGTALSGAADTVGRFAKSDGVKNVFGEAVGSVRAFGAAWRYNDGEITSSGLPGFMEQVGYIARQAFDKARDAVGLLLPHIKTFGSDLKDLLGPIGTLGKALGDTLIAAFKAMAPYLKIVAAALGVAFVAALKVIPPALRLVIGALTGILNLIRPTLPLIAALAAAYLAYRGALIAVSLATKGAAAVTAAYRAVMIALHAPQAAWAAGKYALAAAERFYTATVNGGTGAVKARTFAEKAGLVLGKAKVVVTNAMAAAQRLLNAALLNNPIGLVVLALVALVAGMVIAYKKSETFRRIVNAAWAGIKAAASATVGWFRNTAWPWMKAVFTNIGNAAKWLWKNGIKPAFDGIKNVIVWWYQNIVKRYFALARAAFRGLAAVAKWLWNKGIKPAFRGIVELAKWLYQRVRWSFIRARELFLALGRIAKWLYNKGIRPAFRAIATVAKWLWGRIKYFFGLIRGAIRVLAAAAKWLYNKGIKPAFGWIAGRAKWLWGKIKFWFAAWRLGMTRMADKAKWLYRKGVKPAFDWIAGRAKWMWGRVKNVFDKLRAGLSKVREAFRVARNKIGDAWGGILTRIKRPIGRALRWLKNNFVDKLRGWLKNIPGIGKLNKIMPTISVPKGFARGGWTGAGSTYTPAGIVHADEFVVRKSSRRRFEKENPGALDHINRHGRLPHYNPFGYADGGRVLPGYARGGMVYQDMARWFKANFPNKVITSSYRPGSRTAASNSLSYHARGKALDMSPSIAIFNKIKKTFGTAIRELIYSPAGGRQVHNGRNHRYTGITRAMHWDHVHWAMNSMKRGSGMKGLLGGLSSGDGFLPDWAKPGWLLNKVKGVMKGFDASKYGIVGKVIPQMATAVRKAVQKKVTSLADALDFSGGPGMDFSDVAKGANQVMGKAMAKKYGWTGRNWTSLKALWQGESGWNHRAKNPSSGAYGIPQSLPASKMRSAGSDYLTNPKTQIAWGLKYIKDRYGSPSNAYSKWRSRSPHWYANGTNRASRGLSVVGENGPELMWMRGGEHVLPNRDSMRLAKNIPNVAAAAGSGLSGPVVVNVMDRDGTFVDRMRGEIEADHRQQAVRDRLRR